MFAAGPLKDARHAAENLFRRFPAVFPLFTRRFGVAPKPAPPNFACRQSMQPAGHQHDRPPSAAPPQGLPSVRPGNAAGEIAALEEIAALRTQLLEARKQATLGELLGTTTHEFNNALTTILNYARLGIRHSDKPTRDKALERILSAGNRAAKIAASALSMARGQQSSSPRMEPVDLVALAEEVLVLLEREMMKYRVQVEREFSPVPRVLADPGKLQQVFLNLMVNARQAMPDGGRLILRISTTRTRQSVNLLVRDTGCGMTPDVMQKMFEPNFSTKDGPDETGKGGSGLGLAACYDILQAHSGRIRVESSPGKGTGITIRLPALQPTAAAG